jgi:hypothetical protein
MSFNDLHPPDNELLAIVVDGQGFSEKTFKHVEACLLCSEKIKTIEAGLCQIGDTALELAPDPSRIPHLFPENQRSIRWRPSLAMVFTLSLVLWGTFGVFSPWKAPMKPDPEIPMMEGIWEDDRFMDEVAALSENALPEEFMDLLSESDLEGFPENTGEEKPDSNPRSFFKSTAMKGKSPC